MKKTTSWWRNSTNLLFQASPGVATLFTPPTPNQASSFFGRIFDPNMSFSDWINTLFISAISIGAMLAVLRLGYAGFLYMASELWTSKQKARSMMTETIVGLLLLLSVWLILNQINPQLLNLDILKSSPGQQQGPSAFPQP